MTAQPPVPAEAVLRALLDPRDQEIIASDLREEYRDQVADHGVREARSWYVRQVFGFLIAAPWFACCLRTAAGWFAAFLAAAIVSVSRPVYTPFPAVAIFLLSIPVASFYVANRTRNFRAGIAAVLLSCTAMLCATAWFIATLQLRHPPMDGLIVRLSGGILFAAVCAFAGKASREGAQAEHLFR